MTPHPSQSLCARTEPLTSEDPSEVGGYRIEGRVSDGGGGVLYAARRDGGEPVLLGLARGREAGEPLPEPEAGGVCAVGAIETGEHDGRPWSVLPDQPGPDLRGHVAAHGALPEWGAVVLAAAVAEALAVLHGEGTAHGQVGPDAVVLTGAGPRLLDTGLGRRADAPEAPGLRGVPGWVAPEVYEDGRSTAAADVFGWAALVVLAATGREPFGESPASRLGRRAALVEMERRARQDGVDLEGVPAGLREVVARALSPEPGERPSAEDVLAVALRHLDGRDGGPAAERLRAALPGGAVGAAAAGVPGGSAASEAAAAAAVTSGPEPSAASETEAVPGGASAPGATAEAGAPTPAVPGAPEAAAASDASSDSAANAPETSAAADDPDVTVVTGDSMASAAADAVAAADASAGGGASSPPDTDDPVATAASDDAPAAEAAADAGPVKPAGTLGFGIYTEPVTLEGSAVAPPEPAGSGAGSGIYAEPVTPEGSSVAPSESAGAGAGFGIYTEPVTPEGSAAAPSAPAGPSAPAVPSAAPGTGFGIYAEPATPEGSAVAPGGPGTSNAPADTAPAWGEPQGAAGTTATMVREPAPGGRAGLLVNAAVVGAVLLGVLVVMLFRTGVL
ncbi:protein kinase [Nocardiopsis sp. NPDC057823]|uniref:protein kinase domain-containing protein n=1 Tax=Nocardiopsis sp. NPDC057823 TaxID=3346256 RepID=UPI00366B9859